MKTCCILTQSHLCRNPRVVKEALLLDKMGVRVIILTCKYADELSAVDRELIRGTSITISFFADMSAGSKQALLLKIVRKAAIEAFGLFGLTSGSALGYGFRQLVSAAKKVQADLYICHQEMATIAGVKLLKKGFPVAFDLEDWYSEDLLPRDRKKRPISLLQQAEKKAVNEGKFTITTSKAMARALAGKYSSPEPAVIYNTFSQLTDTAVTPMDRPDHDHVSLVWFSQTIGRGRGLEQLFLALNEVKQPVDLHLRGNSDAAYINELKGLWTSSQHRLFVHEMVSPDELPYRLREHDIGLALELSDPPSRNLTVTNKLFHYLQAGLPIVASDTAGQREMAEKVPGAIFTFPLSDISTFGARLNTLVSDAGIRQQASSAAKSAFNDRLSWERESINYRRILSKHLDHA